MKKKVLIALLCVAALVIGSVFGTMAYLTDSEAVTNTFTVGKVYIDLDEAPVGATGKEITGDRVKENEYHLIPGSSYDKDPTVTVLANSENSWLFVKVENGISAIEAAANTIASQIEANGWQELDGVDNVYYRKTTKSADAQKFVVFESFTIDGDSVDNAAIEEYANAEVKVTAYAIQAAGFTSASAAWTAGNWN